MIVGLVLGMVWPIRGEYLHPEWIRTGLWSVFTSFSQSGISESARFKGPVQSFRLAGYFNCRRDQCLICGGGNFRDVSEPHRAAIRVSPHLKMIKIHFGQVYQKPTDVGMDSTHGLEKQIRQGQRKCSLLASIDNLRLFNLVVFQYRYSVDLK